MQYTTTFRLKNWQKNTSVTPDIISRCDPVKIILCSTERGMFLDHGAETWLRPIGKLLDARLCIHVKGGTPVTSGSVDRQWQLFKHLTKPSEFGADISIEEYLG